jgi:branched-chain amino acid transport system permease protein
MTLQNNNWLVAGIVAVLTIVIIAVVPRFYNEWEMLQLMIFIIFSILALSLAFIWGYGGILSFGHAVFFGIGAYTYAICALNIGETTLPLLLAMIVPAMFAALLGYFMFYGRISDVYLGAITLSVTLIFFKVMNSTAGPQWKIGDVALGGFNGIPSVPTLNVPGFPDWTLTTTQMFSLCLVLLASIYVGLRFVISSNFGRIVVSIKENETRAELLGYDARKYKLITFVIGGAIAGLSGCLFSMWGNYTSPTVFALSQSVQIIIWVVVGGVGTLSGSVIGCFAIQWLTSYLTTVNFVNKDVVLGALLTAVVLLVPAGLVPSVQRLAKRTLRRVTSRKSGEQQ